MVLIILGFGAKSLCCLHTYLRFLYINTGNLVATCWEIAVHSAFDRFSFHFCLIAMLVFSYLGFWSGTFSKCYHLILSHLKCTSAKTSNVDYRSDCTRANVICSFTLNVCKPAFLASYLIFKTTLPVNTGK